MTKAFHTCGTTESLAQRGVDDVNTPVHAAVFIGAATLGPQEASGMALVHKQVGAGEPECDAAVVHVWAMSQMV